MSIAQKIYINHHIAELQGVDHKILNDPDLLLQTTLGVAQTLGLTVVNTFIHKFDPHGLSLLIVISQSHIAVHTWPEYGYLHMDILSCSKTTDLSKLEESLQKEFNPQKLSSKKIDY